MPKTGMEPIRRTALIEATLAEIGAAGSLDITVSQIAKRAGVSSALAHHYLGGKDQIFLAAMRHTLGTYGAAVRTALDGAEGPRARLGGIIEAGFGPGNFDPGTVNAWMNFYVLARSSPEAARLLRVYHKRLRSNLLHELRPLVGGRAEGVATRLAAMIDGLYLQHGLGRDGPDGAEAARQVTDYLDLELAGRGA